MHNNLSDLLMNNNLNDLITILNTTNVVHEAGTAIEAISKYGADAVWAIPAIVNKISIDQDFFLYIVNYENHFREILKQCGPSGATVATICLASSISINPVYSVRGMLDVLSIIEGLIESGADGSLSLPFLKQIKLYLEKATISDFAYDSFDSFIREGVQKGDPVAISLSKKSKYMSAEGKKKLLDEANTMILNGIKRIADRLEILINQITSKNKSNYDFNNDIDNFMNRILSYKAAYEAAVAIRTPEIKRFIKQLSAKLHQEVLTLSADECFKQVSCSAMIQCPLCGKVDINEGSICQCGILILYLNLSHLIHSNSKSWIGKLLIKLFSR